MEPEVHAPHGPSCSRRTLLIAGALALHGCGGKARPAQEPPAPPRRVVLYSRTAGFRHESIPAALAAITARGLAAGVEVVGTEEPAALAAELPAASAVAFVMTTGEVLDAPGRDALRAFVGSGGGFVGVHSAADTEYGWPFYGELVGARFASHGDIVAGVVTREDPAHPSTRHLPERWVRSDEWYCFSSNPRGSVDVLLTLDGSAWGSCMGADHPIAWHHRRNGGSSWYTAGGHTTESWSDPAFVQHVWGGVESVMPAGPLRLDAPATATGVAERSG